MNPPRRWPLVSNALLRAFVWRRVARRPKAWTVVLLLVSAIGVSDYFSGNDVSLSIFYLVPVSLATGWLGAPAGIITALGCTAVRVVGDGWSFRPQPLPLHAVWNLSAALMIFIFVVWLVHSLFVAHRQLEGKVEAQSTELLASAADRRRLELEVLDVTTRERSAFGRELHDELGQHFVATAMAAQVLSQRLDDPGRVTEAKAIVRWIEEGIAKTRKLARGLLLARIEPERFQQELEELALGATRAGVRCQVASELPAIAGDPAAYAQMFRIAQEAVANALRHGHPNRIDITLREDAGDFCLQIEDDGAGFDPTVAKGNGMGLRIMEHRASVIGAALNVKSSPGAGTSIVCRMPARIPQLA